MATNDERGGLQPTPEDYKAFKVLRDFFYQARDTLVDTRWRSIKDLEKAWIEMEAQFDRLRTIVGQGRLQGFRAGLQGLQAYYADLQRCYLEVHARVEHALNDDKHRSSSRNSSNPLRKPRRS